MKITNFLNEGLIASQERGDKNRIKLYKYLSNICDREEFAIPCDYEDIMDMLREDQIKYRSIIEDMSAYKIFGFVPKKQLFT